MSETIETGATRERDGGGPWASVDLKWSLWSAGTGVWLDYAPKTLDLIRSFVRGDAQETGDRLVIETAPKKETRSGAVTFVPVKGGERFDVEVRFRSEWDEVGDIMDTLDLEDGDEVGLLDALPHLPWGDGIGIEVEASKTFKYGARLATVLAWIDRVEADLLARDESEWKAVEESFRK